MSLSKWVLHFDPLDYLNSSDANGLKVKNTFDENNFKEFSSMVYKELEDFRLDGKAHKLTKRMGSKTLTAILKGQSSEPQSHRGLGNNPIKLLAIDPLDISMISGLKDTNSASLSPKSNARNVGGKPILYTSNILKRSQMKQKESTFSPKEAISAY